MSRIPIVEQDEMNDAQRKLRDEMLAGPRAQILPPFQVWMHSPELCGPIYRLGVALREELSIPRRLRELAILTTARFWSAQFEWYDHMRPALEAGIDEAVIDAIKSRRRPVFDKRDETVVYAFCTELNETRAVSAATYVMVESELGSRGAVDLASLVGYYYMVSVVMNVFQVPVPDGEPLPLTE